MTLRGTIGWDGAPGDWWGTALFTLTNQGSTDLVDPVIEFTVQTRQTISRNTGFTPERPAGSNRIEGRLDNWCNTIRTGETGAFSVGVGPADGQPGVGPLPTRWTVNGQPVDGDDPPPPPPPPSEPTAPGRFRVTRTADTALTVAWDASVSPAGIDRYELSWSRDGGPSDNGHTAGWEYTASGLDADTDYRLAVYAVDREGRSSPIVSTTGRTTGSTPPPPPPPPGGWPVSAPFVDATAWPTPRLGKITATSGVAGLFLGFLGPRLVAGRTRACWGGLGSAWDKYEPAPDSQCRPGPADGRSHSSVAAESDYLKWQLAPFQRRGGQVVVSVGGASAHPIEEAADLTAEQAAAEYLSVLDNYATSLIDFDVEGSALGDPAHQRKHAQVLAALRRMRPGIRISHTLPVDRDGWNPTTRSLMRTLADAGHVPDLLVGMLMEMRGPEDYGLITRMAADAMVAHACDYFGFSQRQAWARFGACPMFGQNINRRVFTLDHMRGLVDYCRRQGAGLMSGWDASRDYNQANPDASCEDTPHCPDTVGEGALNTCTRVPQQHLEFCSIAATYPHPR